MKRTPSSLGIGSEDIRVLFVCIPFPLTRANQVFHEGSIVKLLSITESIIIESLVIRQQAMHNNGKVNGT